MKQVQLLAAVLVMFANNSYAKGGCGGHGSCGHGGTVPASSHQDDDAFKDLRKKICTGYIVYGQDTLQGIITCTDNTVSIKASPDQDSTYMFGINDSNLHTVVLTENNKTLFMTRLADKKLYRVFHAGKLSIYDRYFSFDYNSTKFYTNASRVVYDNHSEKLNGFWTTSVKRKLVAEINKVYGYALKPTDYRRKELLAYVSTLN